MRPPGSDRSAWLNVDEFAGAIAQGILWNATLIEHGQQQVRNRRVIVVAQVPATLELSASAASHQIRQREMIMQIAVAHVAAEENDRIVQQIAVAIRRALQLPEEARKQRDVIVLDLHQLLDLFRQVLVM